MVTLPIVKNIKNIELYTISAFPAAASTTSIAVLVCIEGTVSA